MASWRAAPQPGRFQPFLWRAECRAGLQDDAKADAARLWMKRTLLDEAMSDKAGCLSYIRHGSARWVWKEIYNKGNSPGLWVVDEETATAYKHAAKKPPQNTNHWQDSSWQRHDRNNSWHDMTRKTPPYKRGSTLIELVVNNQPFVQTSIELV